MKIEEIIRQRQSTRAYTRKRIEEHKKNKLNSFFKQHKQDIFRFKLIDYTFDEGMKISTYGMISGAHSFIIGIMKKDYLNDPSTALNFGNTFEKIILKATEMELDTCWMVSTFKDSHLKELLELEADEVIAMVSPIGYGKHSNLKHRLTRFITGADKRKSWDLLFFNENFQTPLDENINEDIYRILESVRRSPSAANKQPWRIVKNKMTFDFYIEPKVMMKPSSGKINVTYNDIGIAQCHFMLMARALGYDVKWFIKDDTLADKIYVGSIALTGENQ